MDSFVSSTSHLFSGNAHFIEELLRSYQNDNTSIPLEWQKYFDRLSSLPTGSMTNAAPAKQIAIYRLIDAYRSYGVFSADLDPLKFSPNKEQNILDPAHFDLSTEDYGVVFDVGDFGSTQQRTLNVLLEDLKKTYTGKLGIEFSYILEDEQRQWLQQRLEGDCATPKWDKPTKINILKQLTAAESLEVYLGNKYVGAKRFGLEGNESLIPALDYIVQNSTALGTQEIVMCMAHRGRLNVLVNIMGRKSSDLFDHFEDKNPPPFASGDVQYHDGFSSDIMTPSGLVHLSLAYNPSHLESVNPVVAGSVRARQHRRNDQERSQVLAVMMHGDAALSGLGVNYATLNMSDLPGFDIGGTLHIVVNNQIGFTMSDVRDMRSGPFCTDIAKIITAPVLHVNADDPELVCYATQLAMEYRAHFKKDIFLDIVGFRKLGHNEADDPKLTQPRMYQAIAQHPGIRAHYAQKLVAEGVVSEKTPQQFVDMYRERMDRGERADIPFVDNAERIYHAGWQRYRESSEWPKLIDTNIPKTKIEELGKKLITYPTEFSLHPTVLRSLKARESMASGKEPFDWGMAETLAYASLVDQGLGVRITGEDSERGTFSHRHAILHHQTSVTDETWCPLQHIRDGQGSFEITDSILNEEAVLAYEYGYASSAPDQLVLWEAQYGDFSNSAQVVIDQYISSSETKWGRLCRMVLNLPHGSDGAGPEHTSARLERWLQLCAEDNIEIIVPTRSSQMFHVLRQQMLRPRCKPLIIFMSKRLLRFKNSMSDIVEFTNGYFRDVIGDASILKPDTVRKIILCSGQVYYDLHKKRADKSLNEIIALVRIEKLYPFPSELVKTEIMRYLNATEVNWVQEEPLNQGAWRQIRHLLEEVVGSEKQLSCIGRSESATTSISFVPRHKAQLENLIEEAML